MKKILVLLTVCFLFIFQVTAYAVNDVVLSIKNNGKDDLGRTKVSVDMAGGSDIEMLQFCIKYDSSKLKLVSDSAGSSLSGNTSYSIHDENGKIYFVWDSLTAISSDGSIVDLVFENVNENDGGTVKFSSDESFIVADKNYNKRATIDDTNTLNLGEEKSSESSVSSSDSSNSSSEQASESGSSTESVKQDDTEENKNEKPSGYNKGIELDKYSANAKPGDELKINTDNIEEELVWSSSNEDIATVDEDGNVTIKAPGSATISVSNEDGTKESTCVITVEDETETNTVEGKSLKDKGGNEDSGKTKTIVILVIVFAVAGAVVYKNKDKLKTNK